MCTKVASSPIHFILFQSRKDIDPVPFQCLSNVWYIEKTGKALWLTGYNRPPTNCNCMLFKWAVTADLHTTSMTRVTITCDLFGVAYSQNRQNQIIICYPWPYPDLSLIILLTPVSRWSMETLQGFHNSWLILTSLLPGKAKRQYLLKQIRPFGFARQYDTSYIMHFVGIQP